MFFSYKVVIKGKALQRRGAFSKIMADFWYCFGIYLDGNFCEKTCKKRENCRYYDEDMFRKYGDIIDRFDFLVCNEDCKYYTPKKEEQKCDLTEEQDIFNIK